MYLVWSITRLWWKDNRSYPWPRYWLSMYSRPRINRNYVNICARLCITDFGARSHTHTLFDTSSFTHHCESVNGVILCLHCIASPLSLLLTSMSFQGFQTSQTECPSGAKIFAYHRLVQSGQQSTLPVIVLLHGYPQNSLMFKKFVDEIPPNWSVIVPDLPGWAATNS